MSICLLIEQAFIGVFHVSGTACVTKVTKTVWDPEVRALVGEVARCLGIHRNAPHYPQGPILARAESLMMGRGHPSDQWNGE